MSAILELKYFNTFWLKKIKTIVDVANGATSTYYSGAGNLISIDPLNPLSVDAMNVGQEVTFSYINIVDGEVVNYFGYITERLNDTDFRVYPMPTGGPTWQQGDPNPPVISFRKIINFDNIPQAYADTPAEDWLLEESRITGGYNNTSVDFGVRAYLVEDEPNQSHKFSSIIHSGIFNSRTGVNQTNQFAVGQDISRTVDPANGSIQRLYSEDTNLIIFQENKVSRSLIDKDAIYSAEGNASVTSTNLVIGQNVAFAGEYGISKDPESFAVNGYRKYFTDRSQNVVCRLSMDGITVISNYGMVDYFRDKLSSTAAGLIIGGWDSHNKQYVLSIPNIGAGYETLTFDETVLGWTSLFDYRPNQILSLNNNYFTANAGKLYKHYTLAPNTIARGVFYGVQNDSTVTLIFNGNPSMVKNFQTINYEGDSGWQMDSFTTDVDTALTISPNIQVFTLNQMQNNLMVNSFKQKENKYFANLVNSTSSQFGEVVWGQSSSGLKGFYGEVKMKISNINNGKKELFAISTKFVQSS